MKRVIKVSASIYLIALTATVGVHTSLILGILGLLSLMVLINEMKEDEE